MKGFTTRCLPRMRGDRPILFQQDAKRIGFTPHARGSTRPSQARRRQGYVYPACAGIDLCILARRMVTQGLPRMRGTTERVIPRRRGGVYPACADRPEGSSTSPAHGSLPRMRIDPELVKLIFILSLPRMLGDRPLLLFHRPVSTEFTRMRIDPTTGKDMLVIGLPRMRGSTQYAWFTPLFLTLISHARSTNPIPCFWRQRFTPHADRP